MIVAEQWLLQSEGADCTADVQMLSLVGSTGSKNPSLALGQAV